MTEQLEFRRIALAPDYVAGNDGRIFKVRGRGAEDRNIEMPAHDNARGYLKVRLRVAYDRPIFYVHRLVCEAFHGRPPEDAHARHLNGDTKDNRAANLAWGSVEENIEDRDRELR